MGHRPIFSVDHLPAQRDLCVYSLHEGEGSLIGKITITSQHKLADVVEILRDSLKLESIAKMFRGVVGQCSKIPLHAQQYDRPAVVFFPLEHHVLIVDAK